MAGTRSRNDNLPVPDLGLKGQLGVLDLVLLQVLVLVSDRLVDLLLSPRQRRLELFVEGLDVRDGLLGGLHPAFKHDDDLVTLAIAREHHGEPDERSHRDPGHHGNEDRRAVDVLEHVVVVRRR